MGLFTSLKNREASLAVIGLGYAGFPLAQAFSKVFSVIGFDIDRSKVETLRTGFGHEHLQLTDNPGLLKHANCFLIIVPTPVDKYNVPDLDPLLTASATVGAALKKGDCVIYESTVYPGCTEEDCIPVLEKHSGLRAGVDFSFGYSPERINPGDTTHTLQTTMKVIAGNNHSTVEDMAQLYSEIIPAGVYRAPSIKVAEASKMIENVQRDLNIALMNELSLIFDRMNINTFDVLAAAGTKWNFLKFQPGLVGGHCIGVDPYYLTHKAASLGYHSKVIAASRSINDDMARHVARKVITHVLANSKNPRVLVKGVTFKENVSDIRNSKIVDTVKELLAFNIQVDVEDPYAHPNEVSAEYGLQLIQSPAANYDAIIITVAHHPYLSLTDAYFSELSKQDALVVDLKGIYRGKITSRKYWSL